mgnify:CR=1 FL=1
MRFNWYFEPDAQDVARNNGYDLGLIGDAACKTESQAIWHGKKWMKEAHRSGTVTSIPAESRQPLALNLLCGLYFKEASSHEKI